MSLREWRRVRRFYHGRSVIIEGRQRRIVSTYADVDGGIMVNADVVGFVSWNLQETNLATRPHPTTYLRGWAPTGKAGGR